MSAIALCIQVQRYTNVRHNKDQDSGLLMPNPVLFLLSHQSAHIARWRSEESIMSGSAMHYGDVQISQKLGKVYLFYTVQITH
jgi:hypothetical protein